MSTAVETWAALQGDIAALLRQSPALAEWDPRWAAGEHVFTSCADRPAGARNAGRLPYVEVGTPEAEWGAISTADDGGRISLVLRCRIAGDPSPGENGRRMGEMFVCVWRTLAPALRAGTGRCPGLRRGTVSLSQPERPARDGREVVFNIRVSWPLAAEA